MQQAIVAAEDTRFYQHHGVDPKGVARAFVANSQSGGVSQGASTLTMQYVRHGPAGQRDHPAGGRSEATEQTSRAQAQGDADWRWTWRRSMSKEEILERYLNVGVLRPPGVRHLRRREIFFSKTPKDLTPVEAATLAGLVKSPSEYDPAELRPEGGHRAAQLRAGPDGADSATSPPTRPPQAKTEPIRLKLTNPPQRLRLGAGAENNWGFFCDYLKNWWSPSRRSARTACERMDNLRRGGYRIVTQPRPEDPGGGREERVRAKEGDRQPVRPRVWSWSSRAPAG